MNPPAVEIRETVDVSLLSNLSFNFRSAYEALFELIDNGLGSSVAGSPVSVTLTGSNWSGRGGTLKVVTKGGCGMNTAGLQDFLRWGKRPDDEGLNRYGQGGKAGIGYLGSGFRIRANGAGEDQAYEFEDRDWLSRPEGQEKRFTARPVPAALTGTGIGVVEIEIYDLQRPINAKKLVQLLSWRYRPALTTGALELQVRGKKVSPAPLDAEKRNEFDHMMVVATPGNPDGEPVQVRGWVGIASPKFEGRGGMRCSAFGRVILQNEYFGHKTSTYKASLNSLIGEVDLSFVPPVLNKNAFNEQSHAWEAAQTVVYEEMSPFIESLLKRKDQTEPTEEERERAMEAKDLAHEALDRIAAELRQGEGGGSRGRRPPSPREDTEGKVQGREPEPQQPRTPPPPDAVGRLRRKGASVDWDVRALDPRIRSARVQENGRTEIVINNRYPLYTERKGDILYMLETGLLEELKPEDDEKPVEEYHADVCQAVFEGLAARDGAD